MRKARCGTCQETYPSDRTAEESDAAAPPPKPLSARPRRTKDGKKGAPNLPLEMAMLFGMFTTTLTRPMAASQTREQRSTRPGRAATVAGHEGSRAAARHRTPVGLRPRAATTENAFQSQASVRLAPSASLAGEGGSSTASPKARAGQEYRSHVSLLRHWHFKHRTSESEDEEGEFHYHRCAHCRRQYCAMTGNVSAFCSEECRHSFRLFAIEREMLSAGLNGKWATMGPGPQSTVEGRDARDVEYRAN
jgi:hypothetical protein